MNGQKERGRFIRFAIVGAIGSVVDFGVFNLLTQITPLAAVVASVVSFICAVFSNFTWNRLWTYPDARSKSISMQLGQFVMVSMVGLAIRTPLFAGLEYLLKNLLTPIIPRNSPVGPVFLAHNIALGTAIVVVMLWNFFANRYWTYSDVE
ncbi:MAG: GtrA family protein [Anaerolineaceae bacterium]